MPIPIKKNATRKVDKGRQWENACAARVYDDANRMEARSEIGRAPIRSHNNPSRLVVRAVAAVGRLRDSGVHA